MKAQTSKRILVIDSQPATRDNFIRALRLKGFDAVGAPDVQAGIQCIRTHLPDLIVCDLASPAAANRAALLEDLRQSQTTAIIPLLFIVATLSKSDLHSAAAMGVSGYLIKPCTAQELLQVVAAQLKKQVLLRTHYSQERGSSDDPFPLPHAIGSYRSPLSEALQFISTNHCQPIALSDVARSVSYSPSYLTYLMRQQTGQTVQQWIIHLRMASACALLLSTECSVEDVADQVGYHSSTHFFRQFRRFYGTTPQAWRDQHCQSMFS